MFKKYLAYLSAGVAILAAACTPDFAHAQIINPNPPQVAASAIAGTGLSQAGAVLSVNYGTTAGTAMQGNTSAVPAWHTTNTITGSTNIGPLGMGTLTWSDTNIFGSWQTSANSFAQLVLQNSNGGAAASTGYIVSNDLGTATTFYGEFGMNSSGFTGSGSFNLPSATYLTSTSGDLAIGTTTANGIHFLVNNSATDVFGISSAGVISGPGLDAYERTQPQIQTVATVAALRSLSCVSGLVYATQGYSSIADGGQGTYVCNGSDTTTPDNGGNFIAAANTFRYYLQPTQGAFYVKQFGAKCDGTTNDATAFQNAINASTSDQTIYVNSSGTCAITGALNMGGSTQSARLIGSSGKPTLLFSGVSGTVDVITDSGSGIRQSEFRNLNINCNSTGRDCLVLNAGDIFIVENVRIANSGRDGFVLAPSTGQWFEEGVIDMTLQSSGRNAVTMSMTGTSGAGTFINEILWKRLEVRGVSVITAGGSAVYMTSTATGTGTPKFGNHWFLKTEFDAQYVSGHPVPSSSPVVVDSGIVQNFRFVEGTMENTGAGTITPGYAWNVTGTGLWSGLTVDSTITNSRWGGQYPDIAPAITSVQENAYSYSVARTDGIVTNPNGNRFSAFLTSTATNATGDGTVVPLGGYTKETDPQNLLNATSGLFTANVSGLYECNMRAAIGTVGAAHTSASLTFILTGTNPGTMGVGSILNPFANKDAGSNDALSGVMDFYMASGDTATAQVAVSGGAKTVGIYGGRSQTYFQCKLLG